MVYFYIIIFALIIIGIIYLFVLKNRKKQELFPLLKEKDELERETITEELKKLKNLNISGKAKELYDDFENQWFEIQSVSIDELDKDLYFAESCIDKFNFKKADEVIFNCLELISQIKEKITNIKMNIKKLSDIESINKEKYEEIVKNYKELNRQLLAKRHQYGGAAENFENSIKELGPILEEFKKLTSVGKYIEAKDILSDLDSKLSNLKSKMLVLPDILKEIEKTAPTQIQTLRLNVEEMEKKGFKLSHLDITTKIENCIWQLNDAREKVKTGDIDLIESILDDIYDVVDELSNSLKNEIECKKYVEENYSEISNKIKVQDKLNNALYNNIKEIKNRYQIYSKDEEMVENNFNIISEIMEIKNDIDVYIKNQPRLNYKDLKEKILNLSRDIEKIEEEQTEYSKYLTSLREEEIASRKKLDSVNQEKEFIKRKLFNTRVPGFSERFIVLYKDVTDSYKCALEELQKEPMNIDIVKDSVKEVVESLNIYKREVENILVDIELIEKLIRYANRYRKDNIELHKQLTIAEQYYKEYRYTKSLDIIKNALNKIDSSIFDKKKEEILKKRKESMI